MRICSVAYNKKKIFTTFYQNDHSCLKPLPRSLTLNHNINFVSQNTCLQNTKTSSKPNKHHPSNTNNHLDYLWWNNEKNNISLAAILSSWIWLQCAFRMSDYGKLGFPGQKKINKIYPLVGSENWDNIQLSRFQYKLVNRYINRQSNPNTFNHWYINTKHI